MRTKLKSYFGFAIKSNAAVFGADRILSSKKRLLFVAVDPALSENTRKKLTSYCEREKIPLKEIENLTELLPNGRILAVGVANSDLASAILAETEKETVYGNGKSE